MDRQIRWITARGQINCLKLFLGVCLLSWDFRKERHLLWKTPLGFMRQFLAGLSVVAFDRFRIVGHITLWPLADGWYESGSMWVHPNFRRRGLGSELKRRLLFQSGGYNVLSTTTNEVVKKMNRDLGIEEASFWALPEEIHCATCVCAASKMKSDDYRACALKDSECKLFVSFSR